LPISLALYLGPFSIAESLWTIWAAAIFLWSTIACCPLCESEVVGAWEILSRGIIIDLDLGWREVRFEEFYCIEERGL